MRYLEAAPEVVNDPDFKKTDKGISKQLINIKLVLARLCVNSSKATPKILKSSGESTKSTNDATIVFMTSSWKFDLIWPVDGIP